MHDKSNVEAHKIQIDLEGREALNVILRKYSNHKHADITPTHTGCKIANRVLFQFQI